MIDHFIGPEVSIDNFAAFSYGAKKQMNPPIFPDDVTKGQMDLPRGHSASPSRRLHLHGAAILRY